MYASKSQTLTINSGEIGESPARPPLTNGVVALADEPENGLERAVVDVALRPDVPGVDRPLDVVDDGEAQVARAAAGEPGPVAVGHDVDEHARRVVRDLDAVVAVEEELAECVDVVGLAQAIP